MNQILNQSFAELKNEFVHAGVAASRAYQVYGWLYRRFITDFGQMSDLPKDLRARLALNWNTLMLKTVDTIASPGGETVKFLLETADSHHIESVLIFAPSDYDTGGDDDNEESSGPRITLCVSSQAGCALGCSFCATGRLGFSRHLESGEIISQVLAAEQYLIENFPLPPDNGQKTGRRIGNIVFMGMGEPLLNLDNCLKAIRVLNFSGGYNLGARHFTLSTAGITPGIEALTAEKMQLRLALSLHAASENKRSTIMPIAKTHRLDALIEALRRYLKATDRRVTLEYILLGGINTTEADALDLKRLLTDLKYNLNLISYNPVEGVPYSAPSEAETKEFMGHLKRHGIPMVFRKSKGGEIKAGCGQLGLYWKNKKVSL